ncbi:MAG: GntR family transcriptional regulator, partial [Thermoleophilia bacterium]
MARSDGPVSSTVLVELDREAAVPLHEQIERSIREGVRSGRLGAESQLPSSRSLAAELGISRGVVSEAYGQLAAEGYLLARQGAPVRVAPTVRTATHRPPSPALRPSITHPLDPRLPHLAGVPRDR